MRMKIYHGVTLCVPHKKNHNKAENEGNHKIVMKLNMRKIARNRKKSAKLKSF